MEYEMEEVNNQQYIKEQEEQETESLLRQDEQ